MSKPLLCLPIVIDATNNKLDFVYDASTYAATLTSGTYDDIYALCVEIEAEMDTAASDVGGYEVRVATASSPVGKITVTATGADDFSLPWATGTNTLVTCGALIGFDVSADDGVSTIQTSDYQAPNCWWSPRDPSRDSYDRQEIFGGEPFVTADGSKMKRLIVSTPRKRTLGFPIVLPESTLARSATTTNTNRAFETWWIAWAASPNAVVRLYPDQTSAATYTDYFLDQPASLFDPISKDFDDTETYSWDITLRYEES